MENGRHFDDGKPRVDLISPAALLALGNVLGYGAKKYGDKNWLGGIQWTKLYGSALRHLIAWRGGTDLDAESGLPHLAHALCNIMMLVHYTEHNCYRGFDDRVPEEPPEVKPAPLPLGPGRTWVIDKGQVKR